MKYRTLLLITAVLAACSTEQEPVDTLTKRDAPQENTQPVQPAQGDQEQPAEKKENIIQAYIEAGSAKGRARYVLNPKTALPRIEKYYEETNLKDRTLEEAERIDGEGDPKPGEYGKYRVSWTNHRGYRGTAIHYIKNTRDGLKIDWDATSGFNEMSLKVYKIIRPAGLKVFRCEAQLDDHYGFTRPQMARSYYSILLQDPDAIPEMWGYVRKESKLGKRLFDILKDGETHAITFKIRLLDPAKPQGMMAIIDDLVSEDWLIR